MVKTGDTDPFALDVSPGVISTASNPYNDHEIRVVAREISCHILAFPAKRQRLDEIGQKPLLYYAAIISKVKRKPLDESKFQEIK